MEEYRFRELLNEHYACIYSIVFSDGKRYVGKTMDIGARIRLYSRVISDGSEQSKVICALRDAGGLSNVHFVILSKIVGFDRCDTELCLSILEIKYIRELRTYYPDGYNVSLGGEVLGIPIEYLAVNKSQIDSFYASRKVILVYDGDGNFVSEYPSIARCAYERGIKEKDVSSHLHSMKSYNGYYFREKRFNVIPQKIDVPKVVERVRYRDVVEERHIVREKVHNRNVACIVYDVNGDFVGEYESRSMASHKLFGSKARALFWGEYHKGYVFYRKPEDGDYPHKIEPYLDFKGKITKEEYVPASMLEDRPCNLNDKIGSKRRWNKLKLDLEVDQYTLDGDFVARYASIRAASEHTGIPYPSIYACVKGKVLRGKGFRWKYAE